MEKSQNKLEICQVEKQKTTLKGAQLELKKQVRIDPCVLPPNIINLY